jgi:hypothetical protein
MYIQMIESIIMSIQEIVKRNTKRIQTNFRFPPEVLTDLKDVADKEQVSMTDIVVSATSEAVKKYKETNQLNLELAK